MTIFTASEAVSGEVRRVPVPLGPRAYEVVIGAGLVADATAFLRERRELAVVVDQNVRRLPAFKPWETVLGAGREKFEIIEVPAGETSKDLRRYGEVLSSLARKAFSRRAVVAAVGGGVVGDLAGFVAATYLRGVDFVQVPASLLAMVDSSVGGKTGINLPEGKNLVGAFCQPRRVWADLDFLGSLPPRELAAGTAEVIKYGLIRDPGMFAALEAGPPGDWAPWIARCVEIKAEVVAADERETTGLRAVLNFGHTLGHAIEQTAGYGKLLHGEAVGLGMLAALELSERVCGLPPEVRVRALAVLRAHGLPAGFPGLKFGDLRPAMARDKKSDGARVRWVLLKALGETVQTVEVAEEIVAAAVAALDGGA